MSLSGPVPHVPLRFLSGPSQVQPLSGPAPLRPLSGPAPLRSSPSQAPLRPLSGPAPLRSSPSQVQALSGPGPLRSSTNPPPLPLPAGAENIERVLITIIQGAVDFPDPIAQKTCFIILSKLVDLWGEEPSVEPASLRGPLVVFRAASDSTSCVPGGKDGLVGFLDFIYKHIVPACFLAPLKPTFDLTDAQTMLVRCHSLIDTFLEEGHLLSLRLSKFCKIKHKLVLFYIMSNLYCLYYLVYLMSFSPLPSDAVRMRTYIENDSS